MKSKMRRKIVLLLVTVLTLSIGLVALTGCGVKVGLTREHIDMLQQGVQYAIATQHYMYDEVINTDLKNRISREVNIIGDADEEDRLTLENMQTTFSEQIIRQDAKGKSMDSIVTKYYAGTSHYQDKNADIDEYVDLLYKVYSPGTRTIDPKKKDPDVKTYQEVTTDEFLASDLFKPYALATKMHELSQLTFEDIDMGAVWTGDWFTRATASVVTKGRLLTMNFVIKDEFFDEYERDNPGKTSMLRGATVTIEIVSNKEKTRYRFQSVMVQDYIALDDDTLPEDVTPDNSSLDEVYRFTNVYRGPFINLSDYTNIVNTKGAVDKDNKFYTAAAII